MFAVLGFVGVLVVIVGLIHFYLWKRLVRDTLRPGRPRRAGTAVAVLLGVLVPATMIGVRSGAVEWLAWPGYLWLALMFYLLVVLLVLEVPRLAVVLWWRSRRTPAVDAAPGDAAPGDAAPGDAAFVGAALDNAALDNAALDNAALDNAALDNAALVGAERPGAERPGPERPGAERPGAERPGPGRPGADGSVVAGVRGSGAADGVEHDPGRRLLLARGAAIFAGLTAAGITGYGVRTALGGPQLDRVQIPLAKLPRAMDGTRLAVVSDIHLGPLAGAEHTRRIVDMINSVGADVVAIVGDLVDGSVAELGPAAAGLADIRARHGAYFVTGNHEYYSGYQEWVAEVDRLGIRPLRNERVEIPARGGVLDLAGVNDIGGEAYGDGPDVARALDGRDPSRPVVLMAHQPRQAFEAARHGVDLQVSGHTHGGQMAPFNLLVPLQQPLVSGFGTVDGVPVYVTNGAGFWGPPVRVGAPPQVTLIELRAR